MEVIHPNCCKAIEVAADRQAATYGIITSVVLKAYPPISISASSLSLIVSNTGTVRDVETFWQGVASYYRFAANVLDAGGYGFSYIYPMENNTYQFTTSSSFPGMTPTAAFNFMQPLYDTLNTVGINIANPTIGSARPVSNALGRFLILYPLQEHNESRLG